jgi:hypothetical protein
MRQGEPPEPFGSAGRRRLATEPSPKARLLPPEGCAEAPWRQPVAPWRQLATGRVAVPRAPPREVHGDGGLAAFVPYARMVAAEEEVEVEQMMPPLPLQRRQHQGGARRCEPCWLAGELTRVLVTLGPLPGAPNVGVWELRPGGGTHPPYTDELIERFIGGSDKGESARGQNSTVHKDLEWFGPRGA